jgi:hypothetical protein
MPRIVLEQTINCLRHPSRCRGFASAPTRLFFADYPILIAANIIHSIHDFSGLPYSMSIPLTAIVLRTAVTLPLAIYSQYKMNRRIELRPIQFFYAEWLSSSLKDTQQKKHLGAHLKGPVSKKIVQFVARDSINC